MKCVQQNALRQSSSTTPLPRRGRTLKRRTLIFAGLLVLCELVLVGYDLTRLQDGLEKPSPEVQKSSEQSSTGFTAPPPINDYEYFDVAVEDNVLVRVHARETPGATANIYMIHGAGGGAWVWEDFFDHLPDRYNLYALSWRGHFESSPVEDADASDYVGDQIAVLDAIENRNDLPVHVVGHSYGGATSALMAAQPNIGIASLHLLAPVAPLDYSITQRLLVPIMAPAFIGTENEPDGTFGGMFLSETRMHHWFNAYAGKPYSREKRGLIARDGISPAWQHELTAAYETLSARHLPVEMIIARYDNVVVSRRQKIAANLATASVVTIESGHYIPLDIRSKYIAEMIASNISRLQSES